MGSVFGPRTGATATAAPPPAPTVTPPARMPDPADPGVIEAKRRAQTVALSRGGRASTILTGRNKATAPAPTFDSYSGTNLGASS